MVQFVYYINMKKILLSVFIILMCLGICGAFKKSEISDNVFMKNGLICDAKLEEEFACDEIIVIVNNNSKIYSSDDFNDINCLNVVELMGNNYNNSSNFKKILKLELNSDSKDELLYYLNKLEENENVYFAEPNYYLEETQAPGTNSKIKSSNNNIIVVETLTESTVNSYALEMINAYDAWNIATGDGVLVGVLDTGIDNEHLDLWGQISSVYSESFVNNDEDPFYDDLGHGTAIAGVIGAANNGIGLKGIAYDATLSSLKMANNSSSSISNLASAIEGFNLAMLFGVKVINFSWGFSSYDYMLYQAILNYNKLVVCAAGNNQNDNDNHSTYPASYGLDNIISVGAVDENYNLLDSNYGENSVDIFAPGYNIFSTTLDGMYSNEVRCTSIAAAFVTGAAALIIDKYPTLSAPSIKNRIIDNATEKLSLNNKCVSNGVLNIYDSLG